MTEAQPATAPSGQLDGDAAYLDHVRHTEALRRVIEANAHAIYAGVVLTAEAEGLFIALPDEEDHG